MKFQLLKFRHDRLRLLELRWFYRLCWLCNVRLGSAFGGRRSLLVGFNVLLWLGMRGASLGRMFFFMMLFLTVFLGVRYVSWISHQLIDGCRSPFGRIWRRDCSH